MATAPAPATSWAGSSALPPAAAAYLPQTATRPSADTPVFGAEMRLLWAAITGGVPDGAYGAFFPQPAYLQVKALSDDAADYADRLIAHYRLDIEAAHEQLGSSASAARLVEVLVPTGEAAWIPPGDCYNKIGYWHLPGARLVYRENGEERSIGIASLISWRGLWYVVHLGAVRPPGDEGVVDNPAAGVGTFDPPGGC